MTPGAMRAIIRRATAVALLSALLLPPGAAPVAAAARCVNPGGTGGCYPTIAAAIAAASDGDTITVAAGTYTEHDILVDKSVGITGAGASATTLNVCCLTASLPGRGFRISAGKTVAISALTVTGGYPGRGNSGGGIWNQGNLTLTNATVSGNYVSGDSTRSGDIRGFGAGIYNDRDATLTLNGTTVAGNRAETPPTDGPGQYGGAGGGIATRGILIIQGNSMISGNFAHYGPGGGILIMNPARTVTVRDSTITGNTADRFGAAIATDDQNGGYTAGGTLTLERVTIADSNPGTLPGYRNEAAVVVREIGLTMTATAITGNHSGGIYFMGGGRCLAVRDSVIANNTAHPTSGGDIAGGWFGNSSYSCGTIERTIVSNNQNPVGSVGGLFLGGDFTLRDSQVVGNGGHYGGIWAASTGTLTIASSVISNNAAYNVSPTNPAGGGGIQGSSSDLVITNSTISNNTSEANGGGILTGKVTMTGSTVSGNSAVRGGGIFFPFGAETGSDFASGSHITNSTISGNTTGGVVFDTYGYLTVTNATIADNGTGLSNLRTTGQSFVAVGNSILSNSGPDCAIGAISSNGYNLVSDLSCPFSGTDLVNTDPKIGGLANNGGSTKTHAPLAGSPAIDRIPATGGCNGAGLTTDQRGEKRPAGAGCEVGAVEFKVAAAPVPKPPGPPAGGNPQPQPGKRPVGQPAASRPNPVPQPRP